ncbi:MAG: DUF1684 domain-containing protein [Anaerolineales bacterium]|nr:DUF1684 domain-containing protein [Anaerolineales bacterium]
MAIKSYFSEIQDWRKEYERKLASPDGWLAISGLFWLEDGQNRFGSARSNEIALPEGSAPEQVGVFSFRGGKITLDVTGDARVTINDQPVSSTQVELSQYGSSDWIVINDLKLSVIQRGARFGVRVYDQNNPPRKQFSALRWFPIEEAYRVKARFFAYDPPSPLAINNVLGQTLELTCPGYVEFSLGQQTCRLYPVSDDETKQLWFMLRDGTSGSLTYAGGRYLITDLPAGDQVTLDFNKTHNPPCAYTDFATCPLPPPQNKLTAPIMAGEMKF